MPRISEFYGIIILMFLGDHFHARYVNYKARVALNGTVLVGHLPIAARLVRWWAQLHTDELAACWDRAVKHEPSGTNEPLP